VVSDLQGSSIGATRLSLDAADGAPAGVLGLSVYSLEEQSMWIELAQDATGRQKEAADMPYTLGPALRASFAADEPVTCGFHVLPAADGATPKLRLVILQGDDVVRSTPFETDAGAEGTVKVPVSLAGLVSGPYVLRVEAGDTPGKGSDLGSLPIRIR
jgi:hypothetical protein